MQLVITEKGLDRIIFYLSLLHDRLIFFFFFGIM